MSLLEILVSKNVDGKLEKHSVIVPEVGISDEMIESIHDHALEAMPSAVDTLEDGYIITYVKGG